MLSMINRILDWFRSLFWKEEIELTLVGLQSSGKTTFVNVIASGQYTEEGSIPTVGFNMRKITKGNVTIKASPFFHLFLLHSNLSTIQNREICCYSISCKNKQNIDITLQWLIQHSTKNQR
ncbi:hypothetical protein M3Y99_01545700 [Aphelenchoides fujianensis]|nr:hypothetical protein M3Y99_01545700 [Aphelenchoides fujianensis]